MEIQLPNIFEYNNFRKYLEDYQKARVKIDSSFSKSYICKNIGLPNSRSYFNTIVSGQNISKTFIDRFIRLLELKKDEAKFFTVLVKFNQAEGPEERELYFEQLISLNKTPKMEMAKESYEYYKNWYNSAIRAVINLFDFKGNYKKLAQMVYPPITEKKAREAIKILKKLKLIEKNSQGVYKPTSKSIATAPYVQNEIIKQYQLQCFELTKNAIIKELSYPHDISTNILYVSQEGYRRIQEKLKKFRAEIRSIVHKDEQRADRVYQLNVALFPNSKQGINGGK